MAPLTTLRGIWTEQQLKIIDADHSEPQQCEEREEKVRTSQAVRCAPLARVFSHFTHRLIL